MILAPSRKLILPRSSRRVDSPWPESASPMNRGSEYTNHKQINTRPVLSGGQNHCFHFTDMTYIDSSDPGANFSTADPIFAENGDYGVERRIILKFPKTIKAVGPIFIVCESWGEAFIILWDGSIGDTVASYIVAYPITDFNSLTISTVTWNNRATLTYGAALTGAPIIAKVDTSYLGQDLFSGNSGDIANANALAWNCGATPITMQGLDLELGASWTAHYLPGGSVGGLFSMARSGETGSQWARGIFYNPG